MAVTSGTMNIIWRIGAALAAAALALWIAIAGIEPWIALQNATAKNWRSVPERSAIQLEDVSVGQPVVQTVALAAPNTSTGLALYELQEEECTTHIGGPGTTTSRSCSWKMEWRNYPFPLQVETVSERQPLTVIYTEQMVSGPWRYQYAGTGVRYVGWAQGDALLIVGTAGSEPFQINALAITAQNRNQWLAGLDGAGYLGRVVQVGLVGIVIAVCLYLWATYTDSYSATRERLSR